MKKIIVVAFVITSSLVPLTANAVTAHEAGTNIIDSKGVVYYMDPGMGGAEPIPYTSAGAFLSYKFNSWANVKKANSADLDLLPQLNLCCFISPRLGSLVNDHGTVWQIQSVTKVGFSSEAVFRGMGYSFSNVYPGDVSFMNSGAALNSTDQKHPLGTLINDNGTLYIMLKKSKIGVPSLSVLDSWGYWTSDAVTANSYDSATPNLPALRKREPDELNIFSSTDLIPEDESR